MIKIDKIFRDKRAMPVIYILLAVGILMLVCSNSFSGTDSVEVKTLVADEKEVRLERVLSSIDGVGGVSVMIAEAPENKDTVQSVLVVADGGGKTSVKEKIIRAVRAALGTDSHKIEVLERKDGK